MKISPLILSLSLIVSAISAWRTLAILGAYSLAAIPWWGWYLGLTVAFWLFWGGTLPLLGRLYRQGNRGRRLLTAIGAILFGLGGCLSTTPAGLSKLTLELYAGNVWSPTAFEAVWTDEGVGRAPFVLPVTEPRPGALEIVAGQPAAAGPGRAVFLLEAVWPDGQSIPLEAFQAAGSWRRQVMGWGTYQDQQVWAARGAEPATLRWTGPVRGPLTLVFAESPLSGQAVIRWQGQTTQTLDLYTRLIGLRSVTLPLQGAAVWRAELPLNALNQEISLAVQADPINAFPTVFKKIRWVGLPGRPRQATGHQLAEALYAEDGWLELVPDGVRVNPDDEYLPPRLFLTGSMAGGSIWSKLLPWLENSLVVLYSAAGGFLLSAVLASRLRPPFLPNLNILVITALSMVLAGEVGLRLFLPAADGYYVWEPNLHFVFEPDPDLIAGVAGQTNVVINAQGLRGDPLTGAADYHILALGGSTTEALYLDQAEAWPQLVQESLNKNDEDLQVWVGNAGRSGRNTREHVLQAQYLLPQYPSLDALVLLTGINDLGLRLEQGSAYDPHYLNTPGAGQVLLERAFDAYPETAAGTLPYYRQTAIWGLVDRARKPAAPAPATKIEVQNDDGSFIVERWNLRQNAPLRTGLPDLTAALAEYRRNIDQIIATAEAHDVRVILMTQPALWRPDLTPAEQELLWFGWGPNFEYFYSVEALIEGIAAYNAVLLDICRQRQVECIDLASTLPQDTTVFYDDVHFNESGARQVSQAVANYLLQRPPFSEGE